MTLTEVLALITFLSTVPLVVLGFAKLRDLPAESAVDNDLKAWIIVPLALALGAGAVIRHEEMAREPKRFEAPAEHGHEAADHGDDKATAPHAEESTAEADAPAAEAAATEVAPAEGETGDKAATEAVAAAEPAAAALDGKALYETHCAACHQPTGQGVPGAFPPIAGSEYANGPADTQIKIVLKGLSGPIKVKGVTYNGQMMAFADRLTDDQIAAIITHERTSWGNSGGAVTASDVKKLR
ncbi:MAG: cytochrome c [Candidatus Sericytochromatia bacterium]|nr:cytochrome c [Candidatus Tanganyikabacteria bacterium]